MKKQFLLFVLFLSILSFGQTEDRYFYSPYIEHYTNVLPQTPNAANFTIYGDTPVDYSTGVPNINIPIYTLEVDGVQVPISLSYHASGVKVDDLASVVGLKWTLNAGGGIFRSVKGGRADEFGWVTVENSYLEDSWYQANDISQWQVQNVLKAYKKDHDPDDFNYSFLGNSGNFIFKPKTGLGNLSIMKERKDKVKLTPIIESNLLDSFLVVDYNGNKFRFNTKESNQNLSVVGSGINVDFTQANDLSASTGWMLDTITTKNNKKINFTYSPYELSYEILKIGQKITTYELYNGGGSPRCGAIAGNDPDVLESTSVLYNTSNKLINLIESDNVNIEFVYSNDNIASDWKKKLDKIIVIDRIQNKQKEFRFIYGYFFGDPRLKLKEVYEVGFDGMRKLSYIFTYNELNPLPQKGSFSKDYWGYNNGQNNLSLIPNSALANSSLTTQYKNMLANRDVNTIFLKTGTLNKIQYPTGGSTEFVFESNQHIGISTVKKGGLRIKEIKDIDENVSIYNHKFYSYEKYNGSFWEDLTHREMGPTYLYSSDYILSNPLLNKTGYYYEKVIIKQKKATNDFIISEHHFMDNSTIQSNSSLLNKTISFRNNDTIQKMEFKYLKSTEEIINWNQMGDYDNCYVGPVIVGSIFGYGGVLGYSLPIKAKYETYKHLLSKEITTNYNKVIDGFATELKPSTIVKKYTYNNDLLVTREITDGRYNGGDPDDVSHVNTSEDYDGNGEHFWVDIMYPKDYPNESSLQNLVNTKNLVGLPISKTVTNKGQQIQGQFFAYDISGNIKESYKYNKGQGSNSSTENYIPNDYDLFATYTNSNGKPTQVQRKDGTVVSYIWDTSETYVLAKIENATHAEATALVTQSLDLKTISETALTAQLDNIRNGLPAAQVTTFTYNPMVGITSITDPRDETIYYEYDSFGRLEFVKDAQGKILSNNQYYYKN